jgi:hypothetical protein
MKVYFAHPVSHYGTAFEEACLGVIPGEIMDHLGVETVEVLNPNGDEHTRLYKAEGFSYFHRLVAGCDAVVAAPYHDGVWGMGVYKEVLGAYEAGKPVFVVFGPGPAVWPLTKDWLESIRPLSIAETRARTKAGVQ